jgi:hypothetical protein
MSQTNAAETLDFSQLMRSAEGLTQWRPLVLGFATLVLSALLMGLGQYMGMRMGSGFGMALMAFIALLSMVLAAAGFSGVGVMLMDRAKGIELRSMTDALLFGLICLPKFIGFALVLLCATLALAAAAALLYFVCKIPGVGPVLLFFVHPLLVVVAGAFFTAVGWVCVPLFTPAVWDGRGFKESLSLVVAVARQRLLRVVMLLLGLYVVVGVIGALLFAALMPGYGFMTGLATAVLGSSMVQAGMSMDQIFYSAGAGGYASAGLLSTLLIFGVAMTLMFQVFIMGVNLVYLSATQGLDIASSREALEQRLAQVAQKARDAQERARQAAEAAAARGRHEGSATPATAAAAAAAGSVSAAAAAAPALACPQCHEAISASDAFCGSCGHKLQ